MPSLDSWGNHADFKRSIRIWGPGEVLKMRSTSLFVSVVVVTAEVLLAYLVRKQYIISSRPYSWPCEQEV